jgi:hypothetical protein
MKDCVTHHYACDCREAAHAAEVAQLQKTIDILKFANQGLAAKLAVATDAAWHGNDPFPPATPRILT